jgi:hypothetical protein
MGDIFGRTSIEAAQYFPSTNKSISLTMTGMRRQHISNLKGFKN